MCGLLDWLATNAAIGFLALCVGASLLVVGIRMWTLFRIIGWARSRR